MPIIDLQEHIKQYLTTFKHHTCKCGHTMVWEHAKRMRLHGEKGPFTQDNPCDRTGMEHSQHNILTPEEARALGLDNYYTRWSTDKDDLFLMIRDGKTVEEMAKELKRSKNAVNTKIYQLQLRDFYVRVQNGEIQKGE